MRPLKRVTNPSEITYPGLYERLGRVELWLLKDGRLALDGWVIAESYGSADELDEFIGKWLAHVGITDETLEKWSSEISKGQLSLSP